MGCDFSWGVPHRGEVSACIARCWSYNRSIDCAQCRRCGDGARGNLGAAQGAKRPDAEEMLLRECYSPTRPLPLPIPPSLPPTTAS